MRYCVLLIAATLAAFGQDSTNAVARPRNFSLSKKPNLRPKFLMPSPYSGLLKEPGAKPVAPFPQQKMEPNVDPPPTDNRCGHIILLESKTPEAGTGMPSIPPQKNFVRMPEIKGLPGCPYDLR